VDSGERAIAWFRLGYNCAQAVMAAFSGSLGIDERTARMMASGFGGGMGREQLTCGALSGAVMVVGCRFCDGDDVTGCKERVYEKTREVVQRFREQHGSTACRDLIGVDMSTAEGRTQVKDQDLSRRVCEPCIRHACAIVDQILRDEGVSPPTQA
jgi:C_GCAxxG_C_C family probable redox protein